MAEKMPDNLKVFIAIAGSVIALLGTLITGVWAVEKRYAKTDDILLVKQEIAANEKRIEQKIDNDRRNDLQVRIWRLEDRYGKVERDQPPEIRDEIRKLRLEMDEIDRKYKDKKKTEPG